MSKDNEFESDGTTESAPKGKVTAASLISQAEAEAAKGPREAFKAWVKNKKIERGEVERRLILIDNELKQAASDFDKGLWVSPNKS